MEKKLMRKKKGHWVTVATSLVTTASMTLAVGHTALAQENHTSISEHALVDESSQELQVNTSNNNEELTSTVEKNEVNTQMPLATNEVEVIPTVEAVEEFTQAPIVEETPTEVEATPVVEETTPVKETASIEETTNHHEVAPTSSEESTNQSSDTLTPTQGGENAEILNEARSKTIENSQLPIQEQDQTSLKQTQDDAHISTVEKENATQEASVEANQTVNHQDKQTDKTLDIEDNHINDQTSEETSEKASEDLTEENQAQTNDQDHTHAEQSVAPNASENTSEAKETNDASFDMVEEKDNLESQETIHNEDFQSSTKEVAIDKDDLQESPVLNEEDITIRADQNSVAEVSVPTTTEQPTEIPVKDSAASSTESPVVDDHINMIEQDQTPTESKKSFPTPTATEASQPTAEVKETPVTQTYSTASHTAVAESVQTQTTDDSTTRYKVEQTPQTHWQAPAQPTYTSTSVNPIQNSQWYDYTSSMSANKPVVYNPVQTSTLQETRRFVSRYRVQAGDTLWKIAQRHGITLEQLMKWNNLTDYAIHVNTDLIVSDPHAITNEASSSPSNTQANRKRTYHTVQNGDHLQSIANTYGVTPSQISQWNGLTSQSRLSAGDRIKVADSKKVNMKEDQAKKKAKKDMKTIEFSKNPNKQAMIQWFKDREGSTTYSMEYRNGPTSYDCSSAVYSALIAAGYLPEGTALGNTESLFGLEGSLLSEVDRNEVQAGDIFISGYRGASSGAAGHTGVALSNDSIIHMNYSANGISTTPIEGYTGYAGIPTYWFRLNDGLAKALKNS